MDKMDEEILRTKMKLGKDFLDGLLEIMLLCAENGSDGADLSFQIRDKKLEVSMKFEVKDALQNSGADLEVKARKNDRK